MAIAERVRRTVESHAFYCPNGNNIGVTVSVGCASRPTPAMASGELIKAADAALYRAKKTGRNRVVAASELSPARRSGAKKAAA